MSSVQPIVSGNISPSVNVKKKSSKKATLLGGVVGLATGSVASHAMYAPFAKKSGRKVLLEILGKDGAANLKGFLKPGVGVIATALIAATTVAGGFIGNKIAKNKNN